MPTQVTVHPTARLAFRAILVGLVAVLVVFGLQRLGASSERDTHAGAQEPRRQLLLHPNTVLIPILELGEVADNAESSWSSALADVLSGRTEVALEGGRVDVLTERYAIEVDRIEKWHEAIGQAAHYALKSGREPVVALIGESNPTPFVDSEKAALIDETCREQRVKLILLQAQLDGSSSAR